MTILEKKSPSQLTCFCLVLEWIIFSPLRKFKNLVLESHGNPYMEVVFKKETARRLYATVAMLISVKPITSIPFLDGSTGIQ